MRIVPIEDDRSAMHFPIQPGWATRIGCVMRWMVWAAVLVAGVTGTAYAQQNVPASRTGTLCKSARGAVVRLICADPDLAAVESILALAFQDAKRGATPDDQKLLAKEQLSWIRERNQKCGLIGKDYAPLAELRSAQQCLEDAINERIADLQDDGSQTNSISSPVTPQPSLNVIIAPDVQPAITAAPGGSASSELPTFQKLRFSAPANEIDGTIECSVRQPQQGNDPAAIGALSGKSIVKIAINDDANSYRMFENDTWGPFLDGLRSAAYSACTNALKSGRLRNSANEPISDLNDAFEAYSPQGLFVAYGVSLTTPWTLETNQPKARKTVKSDLGIQTWIEPSQLARNPYFFKGSVVGMVIQFDHMLSDKDAVFERSGAQIFVTGVSAVHFQNRELVVLAGRVMGNKGLVSPMGSEVLLPELDYLGAYKCGNACGAF